jgi:hypothetical protein
MSTSIEYEPMTNRVSTTEKAFCPSILDFSILRLNKERWEVKLVGAAGCRQKVDDAELLPSHPSRYHNNSSDSLLIASKPLTWKNLKLE